MGEVIAMADMTLMQLACEQGDTVVTAWPDQCQVMHTWGYERKAKLLDQGRDMRRWGPRSRRDR